MTPIIGLVGMIFVIAAVFTLFILFSDLTELRNMINRNTHILENTVKRVTLLENPEKAEQIELEDLSKDIKVLDLDGFGEWLKTQKTNRGKYYAKDTIKKYQYRLRSSCGKIPNSLENTAWTLYKRYLEEKKK